MVCKPGRRKHHSSSSISSMIEVSGSPRDIKLTKSGIDSSMPFQCLRIRTGYDSRAQLSLNLRRLEVFALDEGEVPVDQPFVCADVFDSSDWRVEQGVHNVRHELNILSDNASNDRLLAFSFSAGRGSFFLGIVEVYYRVCDLCVALVSLFFSISAAVLLLLGVVHSPAAQQYIRVTLAAFIFDMQCFVEHLANFLVFVETFHTRMGCRHLADCTVVTFCLPLVFDEAQPFLSALAVGLAALFSFWRVRCHVRKGGIGGRTVWRPVQTRAYRSQGRGYISLLRAFWA